MMPLNPESRAAEAGGSVLGLLSRKLILVVDDDPTIRTLLCEYLERHEFVVVVAGHGKEMDRQFATNPVDLIVLDINLPGEDGLSLLKRHRRTSHTPIIMLSARGEATDRIVALELGADDFLPKPFQSRELLARIRSLLRRIDPPMLEGADIAQLRFRFLNWVAEVPSRRLLNADGEIVKLTSGEMRLLLAFLNRPNQVLSRDWLLEVTQGREATPFDRSVDVILSRLRQRLGDNAADPQIIETIRNEGYMLLPKVERLAPEQAEHN